MKKILEIFLIKTKYKDSDIDLNKIEKYQGINNESYFIHTSDGIKWQLKFGVNQEKSIDNEINFLKKEWKLKFYYGDNFFIKELIAGNHFDINFLLKNIDQLEVMLNQFHIKEKQLEVDYLIDSAMIGNDNFKKYQTLLEKYKNDSIVRSHNDINLKNILHNENGFFLIDFEWSKNNYEWFDVVNLMREENFNLKQIKQMIKNFGYLKNVETTLDYLYINTYFSYLWTLNLQDNQFKIAYLAKVRKQLDNVKDKMKRIN